MTDELQPAFEPRRAEEPGQTFRGHDAFGERITVVADDDGVAWPKSQAEADMLESFDLPVARKAIAALKDGIGATAAVETESKPAARRAPKEG